MDLRDSDIGKQSLALKRIAQDLSTGLHRIAWEIRPSALDTLGLQDAIVQMIEDWKPHCSLEFDIHIGIGEHRLASEVESALYRVIQEGITNIVRHADAKRVGIVLDIRDDEIICIIEDDGSGLPSEEIATADRGPGRLGIVGARERLALVEGSLEVESVANKGTTLFVKMPLRLDRVEN